MLSDRFSGAQAINMRHQPIPWAYRVFYRHIGLDPDEQRTPVEELALERMKHGGFRSQNLLDDALTIAIIESGVAMRAFDGDRVGGSSGSAHRGRGGARGPTRELPAGHPGDRRLRAPGGAAVRRRRKRPRRRAAELEHAPGRDQGGRRAADRRRGGTVAGLRRSCGLRG